MRAHIAELGRLADTFVCAYPNAGLPNEFGYYDESPAYMADLLREFAQAGLVNIVGGCCGTTPEHIAAIAKAVAGKTPRPIPDVPRQLRLSGLESFARTPEIPFVNVGERTNVTGSAKFRKLVTAGDYTTALSIAREQVDSGAQVIDVNMAKVPYKDAVQAINDLAEGRIHAFVGAYAIMAVIKTHIAAQQDRGAEAFGRIHLGTQLAVAAADAPSG